MLVHDWSRVHWHDGFRSRWPVSQGAVGPLCVAVLAPALNVDLCFSERVKELPVQQFVPEPGGVEALDITVLPRAAPLDKGGFRADRLDPGPDVLRNELRPVVAAHECGWAAQYEQVCQHIDNICRVQSALQPDCQAFPAELVEDVQSPERLAIIGAAIDKVIAPDVITILRLEPDT